MTTSHESARNWMLDKQIEYLSNNICLGSFFISSGGIGQKDLTIYTN